MVGSCNPFFKITRQLLPVRHDDQVGSDAAGAKFPEVNLLLAKLE